MPLFFDLSFPQLVDLFLSWDEPSYRAKQLWQGVYKSFWDDPMQFTPLPMSLRRRLEEIIVFKGIKPVTTIQSRDKFTIKTLFDLHDNLKVEAVLMRYNRRNTLCISTQVGCAMGCVFCATGQMGFRRNLTSGEIISQVMYYAHELNSKNEKVTNIVIMGMGEPFHNYRNTLEAVERLNDPEGYSIGARRFTISTVGLIPAIKKFTEEKHQINLAISLHATDNELRSSMLPVNNKYPVEDLLGSCREYVAKTGRRITFEWALINGVNDSIKQAKDLAAKVKGLLCHVNIIQLNPTPGFPGKGTSQEKARIFLETLENSGIPCTIRLRRGIEIQAGCGQLASLV